MSTTTLPPSAIILPSLAFTTVLLCIPPFVVHYTARNFAATTLLAGIVIANVQNFVNALIWPSYPLEVHWDGQGLCDVEVTLYIGIGVAISGAIASIYRQLAAVLDTDKTAILPSKIQRYTTRTVEIGLCLVLPMYTMIIHYVVQPNRYYIVAVTGCIPSFATSWVSYILIVMWPIIICIIGVAYCAVAIFRLIKYRRSVSHILSNSSTTTKARYIRLFILASSLILVYLPLSAYTLFETISFTQESYSWARIHPDNWSELIIRLTAVTERERSYIPFDRWCHIVAGFICFALFGLGQEAVVIYKAWLASFWMSRWSPSLNQKEVSSSNRSTLMSGPAGFATNDSFHMPIRDAFDVELEQIDQDLEPGAQKRSPLTFPPTQIKHAEIRQEATPVAMNHKEE